MEEVQEVVKEEKEEGKAQVTELNVQANLPELSVIMIVKNEEKHLPKLLQSIQGVVDEIVVVDTGSTDHTVEIAKQFGAIIGSSPWENNFSKARNVAVKLATKPYILWLDADDEVERQDIFKLKMFISKQPDHAYWLRLVDVRENVFYESMQLRVFPNLPFVEFIGRVHEQVSWSLESNDVHYKYIPEIMIFHKGYQEGAALSAKLNRNFNILLEDLKEHPEDFYINLNVARTALSLGKFSIAEAAVDKSISIVDSGREKITIENQLVTHMTRAVLFGSQKKHKEAGKYLKSIRYKFPSNKLLKLTIGEISFKDRNYDEAYKNLLDIRDRKLDLGAYPLDRGNTVKTLSWYLIFSALHTGDFKTAEMVISEFISDPTYKIKRGN